MTDTKTHTHNCSCGHDNEHKHSHSHDHLTMSLGKRWFISVLIIGGLLVLIRPFIISQMLVRVTSYSANSSYSDAVRMCRKIIFIDPGNQQAWTSLGYAYMDLSRIDWAIPVFGKVLILNPDNKGAASFELGQAYYSKGDYGKAIEYFERVRSAGARAGVLLEADILKYRHGTLGFRNLNSMQALLSALQDCYQKIGNTVKAAEIQKEYEAYKLKHSKILF